MLHLLLDIIDYIVNNQLELFNNRGDIYMNQGRIGRNELNEEINKLLDQVGEDKIGDLNKLETENKETLVDAINEVKNNSLSTAESTTIKDEGGYFTSDNTEGALQEIGQTLNSMRSNLIDSVNNILGS